MAPHFALGRSGGTHRRYQHVSILDHLRDLAISGSRQFFFATADNKLTGLFRHKFRLLERDFKEMRLSLAS
jgi:exonuclease SbcC